MFTYEYDPETGIAYTREDNAIVASLNIMTLKFEDMDSEEMSDSVVEMHCDEMEKAYQDYTDMVESLKGEEQYNGRF